MRVEEEQLPVLPIGGSRILVRLTWAGSQAQNKQDEEETCLGLSSPLNQQAWHSGTIHHVIVGHGGSYAKLCVPVVYSVNLSRLGAFFASACSCAGIRTLSRAQTDL
ncbi:hypothetical protein GALMADRAFT_162262 [Galerina marginata CBS 339.88]|uniref:Uncharacterized protein n=1 Tax=Galerina marginata (strain CBS 339.88) TaxID=685588 RepID=A0A067S881_GALM3|nr:hypothetical protein GALMADRAFT_162262 [Galerina marginata CBS 339.88]